MAKEELDIPHVSHLIDVAVSQVFTALNDAVRHATAHLGVEGDHPSVQVVKDELVKRVEQRLDFFNPAPKHDYSEPPVEEPNFSSGEDGGEQSGASQDNPEEQVEE